VINTGNLKLSTLTLTAPELLAGNISCKIGSATFVNGTSVLAPKAVLACTASHTVTTTDIEAGAVELNVAVTANSVLLAPLRREASLPLVPTQFAKLDVSIASCQPLTANMPGTVVMLRHHAVLWNSRVPAPYNLLNALLLLKFVLHAISLIGRLPVLLLIALCANTSSLLPLCRCCRWQVGLLCHDVQQRQRWAHRGSHHLTNDSLPCIYPGARAVFCCRLQCECCIHA
jgi:hypothetical protein